MYNLSVLNSAEFEYLAKDVLEYELGVSFQIFKKGWDKGVDLRYSRNSENNIVVQAKHYIDTPFTGLIKVLKDEKNKVAKLKTVPDRYILFTSHALTKTQVDQVFQIMSPYIKNTNDIYGYERISEVIKNNRKIEEKHYKLWLASSNVLDTILHRGAKGRSEFYAEKIIRKISLYVQTQNFNDVIEKLKVNRFVIITGDPGVGKTTIAYMLICQLLADNYELIYISERISDAENLISHEPSDKQVILFDDFLGSNIAEILNPRNTESAIVGFIERVTMLKNKFLILTTRTTILNHANSQYEKLSNSDFSSMSRYQVEISQYSRVDKATILYNHLFHSSLRRTLPNYYNTFSENKNYYKVIDHKNFSPRLIEFITSERNLKGDDGSQKPLDRIVSYLDNPSQIWKGAYENQLADEDRFLLTTLFSLGGYHILQSNLVRAYGARMDYEIDVNGFTLGNDSFNKALKKLLDGFITASRTNEGYTTEISFLNPSIGDFILNYIKLRPQEKKRILASVIFIEQITTFFYPSINEFREYIPFKDEELNDFFNVFTKLSHNLKFLDRVRYKSKSIEILKIYFNFFPNKLSKELLTNWVRELDGDEISGHQFKDTLFILPRLVEMSFEEEIKERWDRIVLRLFEYCSYSDDFKAVKELFEKCDMDINVFLEKHENFQFLKNSIASAFENMFKENNDLRDHTIRSVWSYLREGERSSARFEIEDDAWGQFKDFIYDAGFSDFDDLGSDLDIDAERILDKLIESVEYDNDDYEGKSSTRHTDGSEIDDIDRLFDSL